MATAIDPAQTRPPISTDADDVSRIFAMLDAANALGRYAMMTLFAEQFAEGVAEYAIRLWATAKQRPLEDRVNDYADCTIRTIEVRGSYTQGVITLHFPRQPKVEIREPAPGVVIALPVEPANDTDDASIRFSLLEVD